jgi:hypothetical protein
MLAMVTGVQTCALPIFFNEKWAEDVYRYFGQQPFWTTGGDAMEEGMGVSPEPMKDEPMKKEEESSPYYDFYSY